MPFHSPQFYLQYFLKRERTELYLSVAIRNFALGLILIFEPIYLFLYFNHSLTKTLLFFAIIYGTYGLLVPFGAKIMAKIGLKHAMFLSLPFLFGYYLCLYYLSFSYHLIFLVIILKITSMLLYWPAFHTDFARFSERIHRGIQVGKLQVLSLISTGFAPFIGGAIIHQFGYSALFMVVLIILFLSALPLFLSKETYETYSDSYHKALFKIFKKRNQKLNLAFFSMGGETGINFLIWPIFMKILSLSYKEMGSLTTGSLIIGGLFTLYVGYLSDKLNSKILLGVGAILRSIAWIIKIFVTNSFEAFLAQSFYRITQKTAGIPYMKIFYDQAALKGPLADEFIIYREITHNLGRALIFLFLTFLFSLGFKITISFLLASFLVLFITFI